MRPQFSFLGRSKSSPKACFSRSPSRCQRVWQGILILATLALAIAANAQTILCYDLFAGTNAPLRSGNTAVIHYSFAQIDANVLSNPAVAHELLMSAQREQAGLQADLDAVKGTSAKSIAARSELRSKIAAAAHISDLVRAGGRLNQQQLSFISSHAFEQKIALNGKAGRALLESRLKDLEGRIASVRNVDLPKNALQRTLHVAGRNKVLTLIVSASLMSSAGSAIYHIYTKPAPLNGKITAVYQDCGLDDSCSVGKGDAGTAVSKARASEPEEAPKPVVDTNVDHAHDDPSLAIGN